MSDSDLSPVQDEAGGPEGEEGAPRPDRRQAAAPGARQQEAQVSHRQLDRPRLHHHKLHDNCQHVHRHHTGKLQSGK